ncbi:MAG: class I SAM-dependent methyltransferase [bacterium]|nr:class I SAM-dependent methyltransferase [bacterium]
MTIRRPAGERYTHGYHKAIVGSYSQRTAEECAAFLLPRLSSATFLLDLGSGPGTITAGLARRVGQVIGLDISAGMVESARRHVAREGINNASFRTGSAYDLPWDDNHFDVVYAHQILQHLADPVRALREAGRVLKPGGLLAVRDADYGTMVHGPTEPALHRWRRLYHQVTAANGGEADAGRFLLSWVLEAGFVDPAVTTRTTTYATPEERVAWGGLWAVRVIDSDFADHAIRGGFVTREELAEISEAFRRWTDRPDGFWAFLHAEVLAVRP